VNETKKWDRGRMKKQTSTTKKGLSFDKHGHMKERERQREKKEGILWFQ